MNDLTTEETLMLTAKKIANAWATTFGEEDASALAALVLEELEARG